MVSTFSILLIVAMSLLLVGLYLPDQNWIKWTGGFFVLLAAIWVFSPVGSILKSCEDGILMAGGTHQEMMEFREKCDEAESLASARRVREDQIEETLTEWTQRFRESAPARRLDLVVPVEVKTPAEFPTEDEEVKLRFMKGTVKTRFSRWEDVSKSSLDGCIRCRIHLTDASGQGWEADYDVRSSELFIMGFSENPVPAASEYTGWSEAPSWMQETFASACVISGHESYSDQRDQFTLQYSGKIYAFKTKHVSPRIALAWCEPKSCFFIRVSDVSFCGLDGISDDYMGYEDSSMNEPWGHGRAEPVVYPIHPHEFLPFSRYAIDRKGIDYDDLHIFSDICFRKSQNLQGLTPSSGVTAIS